MSAPTHPSATGSLLEVRDLMVRYLTPAGPLTAVDGVSLALHRGEALGVVGESGCGKSTLARALLRILPAQTEVSGRVLLEGTDLLRLREEQMRRLRWARIALVPQSSMNALNPVHRVGDQIAEAIRAHRPISSVAARRQAESLLQAVGLDADRFTSYPHQLSGGQRQRVVIAMALALQPQVLIADEPTTALDVITQHAIVKELIRLRRALGVAVLYISHDISLVAQTCDRIAVMYAGRLVEVGPTRQVLHRPAHPYTMGLRNAFPDLRRARRLISIPGAPPSLLGEVRGCPFQPRCPFAVGVCATITPPLLPGEDGRLTACHRAAEAPALRLLAEDERLWEQVPA
ncbi:MAG: ABC transporter ATP-binding protein [Armatimonadota bacterium]|nr:ABC transporter ATP-binding protein [Armatimonadota bacterium]